MRTFSKWLGIAAAGLLMTGCASNTELKTAQSQRDAALRDADMARSQVEQARQENTELKAQIATVQQLDDEVTQLSLSNTELQAQLDEMDGRYSDAVDMVNRTGAKLPKELSDELSAFAAANKDTVEFDAARRVLKIKSDVTFASGSAELTPKAKQLITGLSKILSRPEVGNFELLVAGHTDSTLVVKSDTKAKGHEDNWYLSAHRAIAVGRELRGDKIAAKRIAVVGYADQRPVASNVTETGRAKNRRVEILLLPAGLKKTSTAQATPATQPAKDASAATDVRTFINK